MNWSKLYGQYKKIPLVGRYEVLTGLAQRERSHSCFVLDTLVIIKMNIAINHVFGFLEGSRFVAVDTLCF